MNIVYLQQGQGEELCCAVMMGALLRKARVSRNTYYTYMCTIYLWICASEESFEKHCERSIERSSLFFEFWLCSINTLRQHSTMVKYFAPTVLSRVYATYARVAYVTDGILAEIQCHSGTRMPRFVILFKRKRQNKKMTFNANQRKCMIIDADPQSISIIALLFHAHVMLLITTIEH